MSKEGRFYERVYEVTGLLLVASIVAIYAGMLWMAWEEGGAPGLIMAGAATALLAIVVSFLTGVAELRKIKPKDGSQ